MVSNSKKPAIWRHGSACTADAVVAAKLRDRHARLVLLQNADNLFVRKAVALHPLVLSMGQSLPQNGLFLRGEVRMFERKRQS